MYFRAYYHQNSSVQITNHTPHKWNVCVWIDTLPWSLSWSWKSFVGDFGTASVINKIKWLLWNDCITARKDPGSNYGQGLSLWSLHNVLVHTWVPSLYVHFLQQSSNMHVWLIGDFELTRGVKVLVHGCLSPLSLCWLTSHNLLLANATIKANTDWSKLLKMYIFLKLLLRIVFKKSVYLQ